jgi:hypothetical protein
MIALLTIMVGVPLDLIIQTVQYEICRYRPRFDTCSIYNYNIFSTAFWVSTTEILNDASETVNHTGNDNDIDWNIIESSGLSSMKHFTGLSKDSFTFASQVTYILKTYNSYLCVHDEALIIVERVKMYLSASINQGYLSWTEFSNKANYCTNENRKLKRQLSAQIQHHKEVKLLAIMQQLGIKEDGSAVPLTMMQRLLYGTPMKRLECRIERARNGADEIIATIKYQSENDSGHADALLLKFFILEQFSFFKRFCLSRQFFIFHDTLPETIDPLLWIFGCIFVCCSFSFFVYWIFAWGVQNGGSTLRAWGLNYGIGAIQDIFFVQIAKIYLIYYIGVESSRLQLRNIYNMFLVLFLFVEISHSNLFD